MAFLDFSRSMWMHAHNIWQKQNLFRKRSRRRFKRQKSKSLLLVHKFGISPSKHAESSSLGTPPEKEEKENSLQLSQGHILLAKHANAYYSIPSGFKGQVSLNLWKLHSPYACHAFPKLKSLSKLYNVATFLSM